MDIKLLKRLGNIDQLAGIRQYKSEQGLRMLEVYNAVGLRFSLVADRALDLYDFSYKGTNFSFHTKNGLNAGRNYTPLGAEFFHYWSAGMLTTCGLSSVGAGCSDESGTHPIHGRIGQTPASNIAAASYWEGNDYIMKVSADTEDTRLYGRHLKLSRTLTTSLFSKKLVLVDELTNMGCKDEEFAILYHFNFGHPMLSEKSRLFSTPLDVRQTAGTPAELEIIEAPTDDGGEQMYINRALTEQCTAGIINNDLRLGLSIEFDTKHLPMLHVWKHFKSHDYVLGIEPCNCYCMGRTAERDNGSLPVLPAYESIRYQITLTIADEEKELYHLQQKARM